MSLLGVGSAQIDLILEKDVLVPGDSVNGKFLIKGGTVDQDLQLIECALVMVNLKTEAEKVLDTVSIDVQLRIQPDGDDMVPFSFLLPLDVPPSSKDISYHLKQSWSLNRALKAGMKT
ncbi:hypothetical protein JCM21738_515 [Mesobacillus boroniphilus JCM 21738]|uniref:Uncharacterized protein n=2 Tax=Mesobacillus boroniphilus TaxID=308892 RepID=W4RHE6_9BACI|nr:hypothetical protein JCM21738_515 [Mesobacillus boroniphilus JCM 21738]